MIRVCFYAVLIVVPDLASANILNAQKRLSLAISSKSRDFVNLGTSSSLYISTSRSTLLQAKLVRAPSNILLQQFAMGADDKGKRKADNVVDLTQSTDDDAPHTPRPRKQLKTQTATPGTSGPASQARASSAYTTPRPRSSNGSSHALLTPPASSSQAPESQAPGSSALPFDDDEEIGDGADYENLESYGVINGMSTSSYSVS